MEQKETAVSGKNRIMIFGPKSDGTYIIEFRMADGESLAISVPGWRDPHTQAFPGAHALRAVCAGGSVRNLWHAREFAKRSLVTYLPVAQT